MRFTWWVSSIVLSLTLICEGRSGGYINVQVLVKIAAFRLIFASRLFHSSFLLPNPFRTLPLSSFPSPFSSLKGVGTVWYAASFAAAWRCLRFLVVHVLWTSNKQVILWLWQVSEHTQQLVPRLVLRLRVEYKTFYAGSNEICQSHNHRDDRFQPA